MADERLAGFVMPGSAWATIKRIVQAYYAVHGDKDATVERIAGLAGISRPVISKNNNFLRSIGVVEENHYGLTALGIKFAVGIQKRDQSLITGALHEIINGNVKLRGIAKIVQARGTITEDGLKAEAMIALELNERSPGFANLRTLFDLLSESRMLTFENGKVSFHGDYIPVIKAEEESGEGTHFVPPPPPPPPPIPPVEELQSKRVPIALGPDRRAFLELPKDWRPRDLGKLLKMIELALAEDPID